MTTTMTPAKETPRRWTCRRERDGFEQFMTTKHQPLERKYQELTEGTRSYWLDRDREAVGDQLGDSYARRDAWVPRCETEAEIETLVNELLAAWRPRLAALKHRVAHFANVVTAPTDAEFLEIVNEGAALERARLLLHQVTGLSEVAKEYDAVAELKSIWFDQNKARTRLFERVLAPGMRPRSTPSWAPELGRLSQLHHALVREEIRAN